MTAEFKRARRSTSYSIYKGLAETLMPVGSRPILARLPKWLRRTQSKDPVLVIGGAGYIGSALVEGLLNQDLSVRVLDAFHFGEAPLSRVSGHPNLTLVR